MYPPNIPAPITTTSNGSPPLLLTSGQVLHTHRPSTSWENAVCCTSTRALGSGFSAGSMKASDWWFRLFCQPLIKRIPFSYTQSIVWLSPIFTDVRRLTIRQLLDELLHVALERIARRAVVHAGRWYIVPLFDLGWVTGL